MLERAFYAQDAPTVARALLGMILVRRAAGQRVSGRIVEAEAYHGLDDLASHGRAGRTPRNLPMWEEPGHAYIYRIYGMYWLLNVTCEPPGHPAAVLIRALEPLDGLSVMAAHRPGVAPQRWTNGPGRLTLALNISGGDNRADLTDEAAGLWIEAGTLRPGETIRTGPRIGLGKHVYEPWLSQPWRFWLAGNPYVSRT